MDLAFNEDQFIQARVKELVQKHGIKVAIETGTYEGDTTLFLAKLVPRVFTTDIVPAGGLSKKWKAAGCDNITALLEPSPVALEKLLPVFRQEKLFFYLDAHIPDNPLL